MEAPQVYRKAALIHKVAISGSAQKWKTTKGTASSLFMSVLGDDIVNDLMNEMGGPVAMWKTLEDILQFQDRD
jgi:hypothetical protein